MTKERKEIEKIKQMLLDYDPRFFKTALCDHELELIKYRQELEEKTTTSGVTYSPHNPFYRCKKCMLLIDKNGKPIIQNMYAIPS